MRHASALWRRATGWSPPLPSFLDAPDTLVVAFISPRLPEAGAVLASLRDAFPRACRVGGSTAGEISGREVHDDAAAVSVLRFEHTRLRRVDAEVDAPAHSADAGRRIAAHLLADAPAEPGFPLRAVFVLSEGVQVNGSALVEGLGRALPPGIVITGGLAGDGDRFERTWTIQSDRAAAGRVSAVGLYGERLRVGHGHDGGWSAFGPERRITRARDNVLYELDGEPALALYRRYLGALADGLPGTALLFPLSVRRPGADGTDGEPLVRTILGVDDATQSLVFAGDMPEGAVARLMRANTERLVDSAGLAARSAAAGAAGATGDTCAISVSCVGRRLVLRQRTDEEVEAVCDALPAGAGHVGFYSYGEISPALEGGVAELHNQTMTVTVLGEC